MPVLISEPFTLQKYLCCGILFAIQCLKDRSLYNLALFLSLVNMTHMYITLMPEFAVRPHYVLNVQVINFTPSSV